MTSITNLNAGVIANSIPMDTVLESNSVKLLKVKNNSKRNRDTANYYVYHNMEQVNLSNRGYTVNGAKAVKTYLTLANG